MKLQPGPALLEIMKQPRGAPCGALARAGAACGDLATRGEHGEIGVLQRALRVGGFGVPAAFVTLP